MASQCRGIFHQRNWVLWHCELSATDAANPAEAGALSFAASTALLLEEKKRLALPVRLGTIVPSFSAFGHAPTAVIGATATTVIGGFPTLARPCKGLFTSAQTPGLLHHCPGGFCVRRSKALVASTCDFSWEARLTSPVRAGETAAEASTDRPATCRTMERRVCAAATRSAAGLVASFRMFNVGSDLAALAAHCLRASSPY